MVIDPRYIPKHQNAADAVPFDSAEQAWFWFIPAQQARVDGARSAPGAGLVIRPCEPLDILQILDRLYRQRKLTMDHLLVLRHYGRRLLPPDPRRAQEIRGYRLWIEAMEQLAPALEAKKIICPQAPFAAWLIDRNIVSINSFREAAE